ncbi:MAG: hypothetical protein LBV12_02610 [Puniceicoccales bacterium]|jgi:hypothetical protein|nr:hypothetical protein [Puniceicoccales bacterium]
MKPKLLFSLALLVVIIFAIVFFASRAYQKHSPRPSQMVVESQPQTHDQTADLASPPPRVFTAEQAATLMKDIQWFGDGSPSTKEEKQHDQLILEKYQNSASEIMALFPTLKEASDYEKNSLLTLLFYKKDGRKDILKFLEKTLSQDFGVLKIDGWIGYALSYLEQWDIPSAVKVAPGLLTLKYEPYEGGSSTGAARPMAIHILERHGGQKELEPLTQFMIQREKEFGDQDILYQYAERAVTRIKARRVNED